MTTKSATFKTTTATSNQPTTLCGQWINCISCKHIHQNCISCKHIHPTKMTYVVAEDLWQLGFLLEAGSTTLGTERCHRWRCRWCSLLPSHPQTQCCRRPGRGCQPWPSSSCRRGGQSGWRSCRMWSDTSGTRSGCRCLHKQWNSSKHKGTTVQYTHISFHNLQSL